MQRYISGEILRRASEVMGMTFQIDGPTFSGDNCELRNNMLRIQTPIDCPFTIFLDLDERFPEMIVVPDFMPYGIGNIQIVKAYYQRKIAKFFGWKRYVSQATEERRLRSFTNPKLGKPWPEEERDPCMSDLAQWAAQHSLYNETHKIIMRDEAE